MGTITSVEDLVTAFMLQNENMVEELEDVGQLKMFQDSILTVIELLINQGRFMVGRPAGSQESPDTRTPRIG